MRPFVPWLLLLISLLPVSFAWAAEVSVTRGTYRGWTNAFTVGNGQVEAVIVPETGRVMQFRFAGSTAGPFWENETLLGKPMPERPWEAAHGSFGGDKTWPAPQSAWNWPPPDVFDATPLTARVAEDQSVILTSEVSPRFGIRTVRRVVLERAAPVMHIETTYEKVKGDPTEISVWVITQMKSPEAVFIPVPKETRFPEGSTTNWGIPAAHFQLADGLVRFTRDLQTAHKIGNDAGQMVWVGPQEVVRIVLPRESGATYPDGGCSVEVYTNPDPVPYVELETLGPLRRLAVGDRVSATNTYHLSRRGTDDATTEARRALGH